MENKILIENQKEPLEALENAVQEVVSEVQLEAKDHLKSILIDVKGGIK
jgi:hypothetical protein